MYASPVADGLCWLCCYERNNSWKLNATAIAPPCSTFPLPRCSSAKTALRRELVAGIQGKHMLSHEGWSKQILVQCKTGCPDVFLRYQGCFGFSHVCQQSARAKPGLSLGMATTCHYKLFLLFGTQELLNLNNRISAYQCQFGQTNLDLQAKWPCGKQTIKVREISRIDCDNSPCPTVSGLNLESECW